MRSGARLGVDVGTVRIGVAISDADGRTAVPLRTVARGTESRRPGIQDSDIRELTDLVRAHDIVEVVVGLPISLSGAETGAARQVRDYSVTLAVSVAPVPVRLVDERLTTVSAAHELRRSGVRGRKQRAVIDQVAATHLLQSALDAERTAGRPLGEIVQVRS